MERAQYLFELLSEGGESAIDELIAARKSEELFLDFKRSSDQGQGPTLSDTDRTNLSKAISGFGNSEGGVVIWGVQCKPDKSGADVASSKYPLADAAAFVSRLESAVSGCTVPAHQGVRSVAIPSQHEATSGYAVTLVPRSNRMPHQAIPALHYFIRAGSSFVNTPHAVLSALFGRYPQPVVHYNLFASPARWSNNALVVEVGFAIVSAGPGIVSDLFTTANVVEHPASPCKIDFVPGDARRWDANIALGFKYSAVSKSDYRIAPEAFAQVFTIRAFLSGTVTQAFRMVGVGGASNSVPFRFDFRCSADDMNIALRACEGGSELAQKARREFPEKLLCDVLAPSKVTVV